MLRFDVGEDLLHYCCNVDRVTVYATAPVNVAVGARILRQIGAGARDADETGIDTHKDCDRNGAEYRGGRWIRTLGPPSAATPSATANHLSSHHLPRQLGLRFAPKASTPSRKSSDLRRPVFKIEPKPRRQLHDPLLPAKRRTGQVVLGIDRFTSHAAQMDLPRSGPEEVFPRHRGEGRLDPRVPDAKCHFLRQA